MKSIIFTSLCVASILSLIYGKQSIDLVKETEITSPLLERQPFVSPEDDSSIDDYKRTKRQNQKTTTSQEAVKKFQIFVLNCKGECAAEMGIPPNQIEKALLFEENPTPQEKCLMACMLQRIKIMDKNNKISVDTIGHLASLISDKNELVISIAKATAIKCNSFITPTDKCEAAFQINRCIANGLKHHKIQIVY